MASVPSKIPYKDVAKQLPTQWKLAKDREAIQREFEFKDFEEAWAFMSKVAVLAEKMNHHPEWFNVYSLVEVTLATHDCGGVSSNDLFMAEQMNEFATAADSGTARS